MKRQRALWVIHRTTIDVLAPSFYRDELAVRTWVSDVRRVRSRREYELHRTPDEKPVCRGSTHWVYVDIERGGPAQPPVELQRALMPNGLVAKRRQPLSLTTPPPTAFQTNRRVELSDLDSAAHVNNAYYATYVEQALWDALAAHGWVINPFEREVRRRRLDLQYEGPARYGEQLDTVVWSADVGADGFNAACVIRRDGSCLLQARTNWHWSGDRVCAALRKAVVALT